MFVKKLYRSVRAEDAAHREPISFGRIGARGHDECLSDEIVIRFDRIFLKQAGRFIQTCVFDAFEEVRGYDNIVFCECGKIDISHQLIFPRGGRIDGGKGIDLMKIVRTPAGG